MRGHGLRPANFAVGTLITLLSALMMVFFGTGFTTGDGQGYKSSKALNGIHSDLEIRRPRPPSPRIHWVPNVRVLASSGSEHKSQHSVKPPYYSYYTHTVFDVLRRHPEIKGLQQAHERVEQSGYLTHTALVYPTSTARRLDSWQRNQQRKRYAVLMGQDAVDAYAFNAARYSDLGLVQRSLRQLFGVPDAHILRIDAAGPGDMERAVDWLARRAGPDVDLFLYYSGHGQVRGLHDDALEGDAIDEYIALGLTDRDIQRMVNARLGPALTRPSHPAHLLIMLDQCYAGASTASGKQPTPQT